MIFYKIIKQVIMSILSNILELINKDFISK